MNDELQELLGTQKPPAKQPSNHSWLKVLGIVVVASVVSTLVALCVVYFYLFPGSFKPVTLSVSEEQALESKLEQFESVPRTKVLHKERPLSKEASQSGSQEDMQPEIYDETDASREIILTERELNALLAKNTDLAPRLAIDLSQDLASAKLLIPLDEEFPLLGGKTLKVTAGLNLAYRDSKPIVALRGISIWGVPIPNAWLGNMKNVDLIQEFGDQNGFWGSFAEGIDEVEVSDGQLRVKLKE